MTQTTEQNIQLRDLADAIPAQLHGAGNTTIMGISNFEHACSTDLVFLAGDRFLNAAQTCQAGAFIVSTLYTNLDRPQLICEHPQLACIQLIHKFFQASPALQGIASTVSQGIDVHIGPGSAIGAFVTLGNHVNIGTRVTLYPGVIIGNDVIIGSDSILYPHVTILERCVLGSRVIVHSGTVIGSDGFGYIQHKGHHEKIPQLGNVIIEDDVELGANVTVDRATFGHTVVKRGTKIDNQVQIAHNVTIGEDCILVAQAGIAGSTTLGRHVMIGGQAGLVDHLTIGDQSMIAAGSGVSRNIEAGRVVSGRPAIDHQTWLKAQAIIKKLPELRQTILQLEERVQKLEASHTSSHKAHSSE